MKLTYTDLRRLDDKLDAALAGLASIQAQLSQQRTEGATNMATIAEAVAALQEKVAANTTVIGSANALMAGLSAQIRALSGDPAALLALADTIDANNAALSASVTENTPAA